MYKLLTIIIIFTHELYAQDTTKVFIDLTKLSDEEVNVKVTPPINKTNWEFVIPEIIPGTYMKINYVRFYKNLKAFDAQGNRLKVSKKKNNFKIDGKQPLHHISYTVLPTFGDQKIWDNILACAGSVYTEKGALINFQLINGYFEGYESTPFKIEIIKPQDFYGSSSIQKISQNNTLDILIAKNYASLIDQPILYAKPDTSSFIIHDNLFKIAVFSEHENISAEKMKPRIETIMHAIDTFSGFTTSSEYTFIIYYSNAKKLKGLFKSFGSGSALEHKYSSVYYNTDKYYDSTFSYYNWIAAHEYFHTITPLNFNSEKIAEFNFRKPDMSKHVWMYEGFTDYLAMMLNAQSSNLNNRISQNMAWATGTALKHPKQSMTESGEYIIRKKNIFSWINKIVQLDNFYEKGKLIAMGIDIELMEKSQGKRRLIDVLLEMNHDYNGKSFEDSTLSTILKKYTYPEFQEYYNKFIEGTEIPPFKDYFDKLGWTFYPSKTKLLTFGDFYWKKDIATDNYYVNWMRKKNELGIMMGDTIISINGIDVNTFVNTKNTFYEKIIYPKSDTILTINVNRKGKLIELKGKPKFKKIKYPMMKVNNEITEEQKSFRKLFFNQRSEG